MIIITPTIAIKHKEITLRFVRSPGPGGQNVNKLATGAQLRFNVRSSSSLPEEVKGRLIALLGNRLTSTGDLIIKATCARTQNKNKRIAIQRLVHWVLKAVDAPTPRKATKPSKGVKAHRLDQKKRRSRKKDLRQRPSVDD